MTHNYLVSSYSVLGFGFFLFFVLVDAVDGPLLPSGQTNKMEKWEGTQKMGTKREERNCRERWKGV